MTELSEKTLVHCSVNQAVAHLTNYFQARATTEGDTARINLRAAVPFPGSHDTVQLKRVAIASITREHQAGEMLPHYRVRWVAAGNGPYPSFDGDLAIEGGDDYHSFYLMLRGRYEPPLGVLGAVFDQTIGRHIAQSTARNFLATLADSIESDFIAVETIKADVRDTGEMHEQRPRRPAATGERARKP